MPEILQRLLGSTRFYATLISILVPLLNRYLDLQLSTEELIAIIIGPNVWSIGQSMRSSRAKSVTTAIVALCFVFAIPQNADARGPFRRIVSNTSSTVINIAADTAATVQIAAWNMIDHASEKLARARASAEYRAAHGIQGHVTHLELGGSVTQSGVGWASHDANPRTCLGRRGERSDTYCFVARGATGWYSTCVR